MVMPISPQILQGIANPPIGDFATGFQKNVDEKAFNEETAAVLENTIGARYADLIKIDPGKGLAIAEAVGVLEERDEKLKAARLKNVVGTLSLANDLVKTGNVPPEELGQLLLEQGKILASRNIPVDFMVDAGTKLINGTPEEQQAEMAAFGQLVDSFGGDDETERDIRKETRGRISKQLDVVRKDAKRVEENFGKVKNLVANIKTGNRIASAQAIIALVKIGDDSTVREGELKTALANVTPQAAVFDFLVGEGVTADVARSVSVSFDPLNPDTMKVQDILDTADSLVLAQVPSIQSSFAESEELGETNLTKSGFRSVFSKTLTNRIGALSDLATVPGGGQAGVKSVRELSDAELEAEIKAAGGG